VPQCITYLAELDGSEGSQGSEGSKRSRESKRSKKQIVVKFATRYGKEVHEFLAANGCAPKLHYCEPLFDDASYPSPVDNAEGSSGLHLGPMVMVVMDYVRENRQGARLPPQARQDVERPLKMLHSAGYVLGDLRRANLIVDEQQKVWFIDFDWSGYYWSENSYPHDGDGGQEQRVERQLCARYPVRMSSINGMWASGMEPLALIQPQHDLDMLEKLFD
ncbi:hypothetical protein FA15DRAFT_676715, partial [Coprinopsis marcescibilis]